MALAQHMGGEDGQTFLAQDASAHPARKLRVGQHIDAEQLHRISRPGLYGISRPPAGSEYGVIDGRLVRYDAETLQVQSIIREVDHILD